MLRNVKPSKVIRLRIGHLAFRPRRQPQLLPGILEDIEVRSVAVHGRKPAQAIDQDLARQARIERAGGLEAQSDVQVIGSRLEDDVEVTKLVVFGF